MSGNNSTLRRAAAARAPSPSTAVISRGVVRRQSHRIAPRSRPAVTVAASQARAAAVRVTSPAGVRGRINPSTPTPTAAQAAIAGSSSTVRCRTERWSRS